MTTRSLLAILFLSAAIAPAACKKHEGDVPLRVTNAPACPAGQGYARQVVIRMENGSDFAQFPLDEQMFAVNTWSGRKATVKVALCPAGPCPNPNWVRTNETTVGGGDDGLSLTLPSFEVPCEDGTVAKN